MPFNFSIGRCKELCKNDAVAITRIIVTKLLDLPYCNGYMAEPKNGDCYFLWKT